ncbi:hypothetical protein BH10PSE9_BH10PSE9_09300 [soil metagenome]
MDRNGTYKPHNDRKKAARVKHITVSAEAKQAYEAAVKERDTRDKTYVKHLAPDRTR